GSRQYALRSIVARELADGANPWIGGSASRLATQMPPTKTATPTNRAATTIQRLIPAGGTSGPPVPARDASPRPIPVVSSSTTPQHIDAGDFGQRFIQGERPGSPCGGGRTFVPETTIDRQIRSYARADRLARHRDHACAQSRSGLIRQ